MVDSFLQVGRWMFEVFMQLWTFFGTAGFLGFGVIGFVVLRKLVQLFKKLIIN